MECAGWNVMWIEWIYLQVAKWHIAAIRIEGG